MILIRSVFDRLVSDLLESNLFVFSVSPNDLYIGVSPNDVYLLFNEIDSGLLIIVLLVAYSRNLCRISISLLEDCINDLVCGTSVGKVRQASLLIPVIKLSISACISLS